MALIDEIMRQQQEQQQPPVANTSPNTQPSWVQNLIDQRYQSKTERLKRSPISFNFTREPFDPSSYYNQLGTLKNISRAATTISQQESTNRDAARALADQQAAKNAVAGIGSSFGSSVGNAIGKASGVVGSIIASGMKEVGKPYVFGNEGPNSFDCSGLMQFIFKKNGVKLPRTAAQQQRASTRVKTPRPGDLVFYGNPAHHVALYLGNGKMLAAPHSGANVRVQPVYGNPTYGRI